MAAEKRLLIMAGGTGGHVFPGLALAGEMHARGYEIDWLGTTAGIEARLVPAANIPLHVLPVRGVRGRGIGALLLAPVQVLRSIWAALKIIRALKPGLVVGLGGYVAGPGGVAAKLAGIPLMIHEQNAVAGTTNRILAKIANQVLAAFPKALVGAKVIGNPVRAAFFQPAQKHEKAGLNILVVGGSRGAQAINRLLPQTLQQLGADAAHLTVLHQTGERLLDETEAAYAEAGIPIEGGQANFPGAGERKVTAFIDDIPSAYQWADLVICRSGALTVSELAASGVASILIPFPYAIDDHQTVNGHYLADAGAAWLIQQKELTAGMLADKLRGFLGNPQELEQMGQKARLLSAPDATQVFADCCETYYGPSV